MILISALIIYFPPKPEARGNTHYQLKDCAGIVSKYTHSKHSDLTLPFSMNQSEANKTLNRGKLELLNQLLKLRNGIAKESINGLFNDRLLDFRGNDFNEIIDKTIAPTTNIVPNMYIPSFIISPLYLYHATLSNQKSSILNSLPSANTLSVSLPVHIKF